MQFCPKNRDDIIRYYRNSYIKLREFQDQLFFIEGVDTNKIIGTHESGEKFLIYMNDDTPYEVDYILPHKSFFQFQKVAVQLQRIPAKQYIRGLAESNTLLTYLDAGGKTRQLPLEFQALKAFVNKPEWPTLTQACEKAECTSVALSSRMMLNKVNRQLCVDFLPVATVIKERRRVEVKKMLFFDEVQALIKNMAGDVWEIKEWVAPPKKEKTSTEDLLREMGAPGKAKVTAADYLKKKQAEMQMDMLNNQFGGVA